MLTFFFFSSRRRHTRCSRDWSSDVCSSDLRCSRCTSPRPCCRPRSGILYLVGSFGAQLCLGSCIDSSLLDSIGLASRLGQRSEEHTSELQSRLHLVCRLLLEKKKPHNIVCR